jgi:hypothetical protein
VGLSPISPIFTPCGLNFGIFFQIQKPLGWVQKLNFIPCIHFTHFPMLEIVYIQSLKQRSI